MPVDVVGGDQGPVEMGDRGDADEEVRNHKRAVRPYTFTKAELEEH